MSNRLINLGDSAGQTMAEYAVVLGVITFTVVTTFSLLSRQIQAAFDRTVGIVSSVF
jgi:Flp pilus assembly pilin Flp